MNIVLHCIAVFLLLGAAHALACGLNKAGERLARIFRPRCRRTYGNTPAEFLAQFPQSHD